jgi:HK97 family phage prohead protease
MASRRFNKAAAFSFKGVDRSKRQFNFVFTVEKEDRDGEIVRVAGIRYENFLRNPVLCYGHDHSQTIGHIVSVSRSVIDGHPALVGTAQIDPPGVSELADRTYAQIQSGSLRGMSIGFSSDRKVGNVYEQSELLEVSVVPIPANANAIITEKSLTFEPFLELEDDMNRKEERVPVYSAHGKISCPRSQDCPLEVDQAVSTCPGTVDAIMGGANSCPFHGWSPVGSGGNPVEAYGATPGSVPDMGDTFINPHKSRRGSEIAIELEDSDAVLVESSVLRGVDESFELQAIKSAISEVLIDGLRDHVRRSVSLAIRQVRGRID